MVLHRDHAGYHFRFLMGCARRAGRLPSGGTAFFAKKAVGKKAQRGGYPPLDFPKAHPGFHSAAAVFPKHGVANSGLSAYPESVVPWQSGRPHKRPPFWRGVERGTRSSPLRLFFSPFLFREKKWGSRRVGGPRGERNPSGVPGHGTRKKTGTSYEVPVILAKRLRPACSWPARSAG